MANCWHELLTVVPVPRGHKPSGYNCMRLEVLTAITIWCSAALLWDVTPCILVEMYRHFRIKCCLHPRGKTGSGEGSVTGRYDNSNESSFSMKSGIIDELSDY